ncbi:hypothetical protein KY289_007664 [Solanum tuberosum]|nr:hypothetical protein KY289_007664 [Solanum tuberosum]
MKKKASGSSLGKLGFHSSSLQVDLFDCSTALVTRDKSLSLKKTNKKNIPNWFGNGMNSFQ